MTLTLTSPAFADGQRLPDVFARDGQNQLPPLQWSGAPKGVRSYALLVNDPDAPGGTFWHAAIYDIPPDRSALPQGIKPGMDEAIRFGRNDFGETGYDGPQPPRGHGVHHYHFRLMALSVPNLDLPANTDAKVVSRKAEEHALEIAEIVGTYERP